MNPRHTDILNHLSSRGSASVVDLARMLQVTPATIRRDLVALERTGKLSRNHGSASLTEAGVVQFRFAERSAKMASAKRAIAAATSREFRPGMTVVLDTGSTTLEVAKVAARTPELTILTSSLAIAAELHAVSGLRLVLLGGEVRQTSPDLSGILTEMTLSAFKVDLAVLGAEGVLADGAYCQDVSVGRLSRAMVGIAARSVIACDSSKFGVRRFFRHAAWPSVQAVYTDRGIGPDHRQWFGPGAPELVVAR